MAIATMTQSFIEVQFPATKLSAESYKERKATGAQTLTGLGKWWGRKPLVLVRAILLGLLLPASDNPQKDQEIFLKLLTMDNEGLWDRKNKTIPLKVLWKTLEPEERPLWFNSLQEPTPLSLKFRTGMTGEERETLQRLVFDRLSYEEKLEYCDRPEHIECLSENTWKEINRHLETHATNLQELVSQLGVRLFGHTPLVGDVFCGGGSIPFEAARIGFNAYGSDLNPVASLLTWASLNILGKGEMVPLEVREAQQRVYDAVEQQIMQWGIEQNEQGWRADAYLYCNETRCPECGWMVPLAPSWVIGEKTHTIANLVPNEQQQRFVIHILSGVSEQEMELAKKRGTVRTSLLVCPNTACRQLTPLAMLRGDRRDADQVPLILRLWENNDLVPQINDLFQERLYCIRWVDSSPNDGGKSVRHYRAPDEYDLQCEQKVLKLLQERFSEWQEKGYIPHRPIEPGEKTSEPIRTRGWTHWHHLFNPRQLLVIGSLVERIMQESNPAYVTLGMLLSVGRSCDYNARLSRWRPHGTGEKCEQVFTNQALNPLANYGTRTLASLRTSFFSDRFFVDVHTKVTIKPIDAREVTHFCDIWVTDPPYADAVVYHELSEFFLAWYEKHLQRLLPDWYIDSRRDLAISGRGEPFRKDMVRCYQQLVDHMPDQGIQVVMFTHQDASVWADLTQILWEAKLRVTAAWCVETETATALRKGNYVQGTVVLVLRKQTSSEIVFTDELYHEVEEEVIKQLTTMTALDGENISFSDNDYHLAAYAAAVRALTRYNNLGGKSIAEVLSQPRKAGEEPLIKKIIAHAVKIAGDYLVPQGFDSTIWRILTPEERFYLKGLALEFHGEKRVGAYQELARGLGVQEYAALFASTQANQTRLKNPVEFATRTLGGAGFGSSRVRNLLFALYEIIRTSEIKNGKAWLHTEVSEYWNQRNTLIGILRYLATLQMQGWEEICKAAALLMGALKNDHV